MGDNIEKVDLKSEDLVDDRLQQLKKLVPEAFSESGIDFDKLRLLLGDEVDEGDERYAFTWPGKADAIRQSQTSTTATLRPVVAKSRGRDGKDGSFDSDNIYIEGDNLEALKLLQRAYHGKVKMIYIDPPYNTGKDFVYRDNFGDTVANYRQQAGLTGQSNSNTSGRFHSDWCSMIYPRIRLARELLRDDGVMFISIGEEEGSTLKNICLEIFGESNFVGNIIWQSRTSISNDDEISTNHNHTLVFSKNREMLDFGGDEIDGSEYSNPDNDPRGPWTCVPIDANHAGGDTQFPITNPNTGVEYYPPNGRSWAYNRETIARLMADGRIAFGTSGNSAPKRKLYLKERIAKGDTQTPSSILLDAGTTKNGTVEIMELLGDKVFDFPKPSSLIERLLHYGMLHGEGIFLDFFSGTASSSHAVMRMNEQDGGKRRFIAVQLDENLEKSRESTSIDARKTADRAIKFLASINRPPFLTEIGEERIRRAGDKIAEDISEANKQPKLGDEPKQLPDIGFRVFELDDSGIAEPQNGQLLVDRRKADRSDLDIIFEVMLKWGYELTYPIEMAEFAGYGCCSVAAGDLICCMEPGLTVDALEAIAAEQPRRVFIMDSVFEHDDSLKLDALAIFKHAEEKTQQKIELRTV